MSDYQPAPAVQPQPPVTDKRSNPFGLVALIVGIVAIVGCAIPIVNFVSIFLGVIALIFGIIGLVVKGRKRGLAIAGAILGVLSLIIGISTAAIYGSIATSVSKAIESSAPLPTTTPSEPVTEASGSSGSLEQRTVRYEVTTDGSSLGSVTYLTVNDGTSSQAQDTAPSAPWSKDITIADQGLFTSSLFSLVAQASGDATTITCKITADGQTIQESTSTGPYAVATCSGMAK